MCLVVSKSASMNIAVGCDACRLSLNMVESVSTERLRSSTASAKLKCMTVGGVAPNWLGALIGSIGGGGGGSCTTWSTLMGSFSDSPCSESRLGLRERWRGRRIARPKIGASEDASAMTGNASIVGDCVAGPKVTGGPAGVANREASALCSFLTQELSEAMTMRGVAGVLLPKSTEDWSLMTIART